MAAPQDFTIEDLLADAQSSGASPLDTAAGLRKWRDDMAAYGRGKHDAEKYWEGIRRLDNDLAPVLENLRDQEANRIIGQLGENRSLFLAQYNKAQGNPDEMAPAFADQARALNALTESKDFSPERVGFASLTTDDGKPLADVVVGRGEALVRPLTGGSAFLVPVEKRSPEEIAKLAEKYKADAATFAQAAEVDTLPITPGSFAAQEGMQSYLKTRARQEQLKADAYATGDPTVIAGYDVGAAIKGQPELLGKIADKDLTDRFQSGLLKASINTARALDDLKDLTYNMGMGGPQDRFAGFEEALAQTNTDTARSFQATTGDTVAASATESLGQMAPTVLPYTAGARLGGLAVREGLAAATMAPASYGQELASMLESAKQAEAAGDPAKANQLRSVARWSAFTQAAIDTGTEMMFPELAGAATGGKGALKRMLTAPLKEGLEEVAAGGLERGVKQPAFYPTDMQQPVVEGMATEALAGMAAGGTMSTVQEGGAALLNRRKGEAKKAAVATGDAGTAAAVEEVFDLAQDFATLDSPPATEPPPAQAVVERDSRPEPAVLPPPESVAPGQVERTAEVAPPVEEPGALDAAAPPTAVEEPPAVTAPTPVLPEDDSNVGVEAPAGPTASPLGEDVLSGTHDIQGSNVQFRPIQWVAKRWDESTASTFEDSGTNTIIDGAGRKFVAATINGVSVPFYLSTGKAGKKDVKSGKWYPFFGLSSDGWINKTRGEEINKYYGSTQLRAVAEWLDQNVGDIRNQNVPTVSLSGNYPHIQILNDGLTPTDNETRDTEKNLRSNINGVLERLYFQTNDPTTEGSVPGGVNDLGASTEGPATGSSAPAVSVAQQTPTQETVNVDLPHLRSLVSSPTIGTNALRHELSYYSPQEREWIARQLGAPDPSPNTLARMLRYQENGNERFTLTPDRPTANMTEAQARAALGNVPKNVTFINDPEARTPWGTPWAGKANRNTGEVTLNLANITDAADLRSRLNEELAHIVWQDPEVKAAVRTLEAAVTPAMRAEMARLGYDAASLTEEAAARLVDKLGRNPDTRSAWRKFLDAVRNALRRLLRLEPTQQQVEQAAREILTYAMSERPAQGSGEMFNQSKDAEYLAAVERGDMETAQRMVDEAAKAAGYKFGPVVHLTKGEDFTVFDLSKSSNSSVWGPAIYAAFDGDGEWNPAHLRNARKINGFVGGRVIDATQPLQPNDAIVFEKAFDRKVEAIPFLTLEKRFGSVANGLRTLGFDAMIHNGPGASGKHIAVFNPNQIKSADPVTRDEAGNVIPLSQRFNDASDDIRYSTYDPREQVFGNRNVGATKPARSFAESMKVAKETYFDGDLPISESTTSTAHRLAAEWADKHTGAQVAAGLLRAANGDELVIGAAQGELHNYAIKLAGTGDASLLNFLQATVNSWAVTDGNEGISSVAALLAGRRPYSQSAFMEATTQVGTGRRKAETTVLSPEVVDAVTTEVTGTKLKEKEVRRVKRAKKDAKGETLEDKVERTIADKSAEQVLNKFATSQSDTLSWDIRSLNKSKADAVRALIRAALETGSKVKQWDRQWLIQSLVDLEVTPEIAARLADTTWEERRRRFDILSNERREKEAQTVAQKMADLATGERGSLSGLEDALLDAPAAQQQDPGWRRKTAREYFSQLGLSPQQAAAAARIYDAEFAERLGDALVAAVERVASQQAPWQEKLKKIGPKQLKKVQTDMDRLRRAVRVGVTHPDTPWFEALAKAHGWKGFTREQNMRLHEIDAQLARHDVLDHEKKRLLNEMQDIVVRANLPPKLADYLAAEYTLSALSGLPTAFVQLSAVFSILRDFFSDVWTSPVVSARTLLASMDSFIGNLSYAGRNDVYNHQVAEHLRGAMPAMRYLLEQGLENLQSDNPATKAKGLLQVIVGGLHFVGQFLSAMDEGSIAAAEIYKLSMFTNRALKRLGWTRDQAGAVILASLDARAEALAEAKQSGYRGDEATVVADGIFRRRIHEGMSMADRNIADDIVRGAASEAIGMVGRLNAKTAATDIGSLGIDAEAVGNMDEGMLSRYTVNPILDVLQKLHSKGGIAALAARLAFGFVSVPFRAARWYSSYSPYGFVRYAIHKHRLANGKDTLWKQSFGTRAQEQQRLRDAIVGTLAQVLAVLARSNSGDDDPEKSEIKLIITGKGPVDDAQRMAWSRRFKPYTMYVKMGRTYVPFNMGRLGESVAWSFGLAGALDDVALTKKGLLARNPGLAFRDSAELFGSYYGSLSQRASFQSIGRLFSSANRGGAAQLGDEMFKQTAFAGSTFIPWKGALGSLTRLASEPVDQNTMSGVIWSNTPVVGPLFGRPALNPLGDPIGDQTLAGKLYREGFPLIVRFPTDGRDSRVYELILDQGFGPSDPRRYDLERRVGPVTPQQFYEYSRARGQYIKARMDEQYQSLKRMSPEQYGSYIRRISENANAQAVRVIR